jgi:hypothetical protein
VNFFEDDIATDPETPAIAIFDPHNITTQTASSMTKVTTGIYEYNFQTTSTSSLGKYKATVSFSSDENDLVEDDIFFYVE